MRPWPSSLVAPMLALAACSTPTGSSHADNLQVTTYQLFGEPVASGESKYWVIRVVAANQRELRIVIEDGDVESPHEHQTAPWDGTAYRMEWPSSTPGLSYDVRLREPGPANGCELRDASGAGPGRVVRTWASCTFGQSGVH